MGIVATGRQDGAGRGPTFDRQGQSPHLRKALSPVVTCIRALAPEALIVAYRPGADITVLASGKGPAAWHPAHESTGPLAAVASTGESIVIGDLATDPRWADHAVGAVSEGYRAFCGAPLLDAAGECVGALGVYGAEPAAFLSRMPAALDALALLAAPALSRPPAEGAALGGEGARSSFDELAALVPGVVYQRLVSRDGSIRFTFVSDGVRDLFGVEPEAVLADPNAMFRRYPAELRPMLHQRAIEASRTLSLWDVELPINWPPGRVTHIHAMARPKALPDGAVLWTGIIFDATRMKEAESDAKQAEERTRRAIVESLSQGFVLYDSEDRLKLVNSHFLSLYPHLAGIAVPGAQYADMVRAELCGSSWIEEPCSARELTERLFGREQAHRVFEYTIGGERWVQVNETRTASGERAVVYTDVSELKQREQRIQFLAFHDPLTQLPNRTRFHHKLEQALAEQQTGNHAVALLCIDLDNFKAINDGFGHPAGDAVLQALAHRLSAVLRNGDLAARLGGDEFALILPGLPSLDYAGTLANRLVRDLARPVEAGGRQFVCGASIGIAIGRNHQDDAETLLKQADLALYAAKAAGKSQYRFFSASGRAQEPLT